MAVIAPGATIGVIGGGQLGRMLGAAARRMGYRFAVWSDAADAPALAGADQAVVAPYGDRAALERFCGAVAVATVEFENLPAALLQAVEARVALRPSAAVVAAAQHRGREKEALAALGVPLAPWRPIGRCADPVDATERLAAAVDAVAIDAAAAGAAPGGPRPRPWVAVLKTAGFGYDGKGQVVLAAGPPWPEAALALLAREDCVVEAFVDLAAELSVVLARTADGRLRAFPVAENHHDRHVLDLTLLPARVAAHVASAATELATRVVEGWDVVGLVCVELFLTRSGALWVNEVAPRPHNSGHATIEACRTDQFEQQLRAVCGLPLGDPALVRPAAMANLLGDLWRAGPPDWPACLAVEGVRLHLYGKSDPRPGRKMGHLTALGDDPAGAAATALEARARAVAGVVPGVPAAPAPADPAPSPPAEGA